MATSFSKVFKKLFESEAECRVNTRLANGVET